VISTQFVPYVKLKRDDIPTFDQYPFSLPVLRHLDEIELHPNITFFVGENGSGKSTLIEAIAVAWGFNPEGGSRNFHFSTRSSHFALHKYLCLVKGVKRPKNDFFLRAESFYNVASEIDKLDAEPSFGPPIINSYGGRSMHHQSHGESFLTLMMKRFGPQGFYVLDEPEAALSPQRQLVALARMHDLVKNGSQFIIATHSPILMAYPDAYIYNFSGDKIELMDYYETEHYQVMHDFMQYPKRMLDNLLDTEN